MCGEAVLSFGFSSLSESPSGIRPDSRPTFFASPKKVGKERRPESGAPSGFPAVLGTEGEQITRPRMRLSADSAWVLGARTNLLGAASGATFRPCAPRHRIRGKAKADGSLRLAWARCARPPSETEHVFVSVTCLGPVYGAEERRGWKVAPRSGVQQMLFELRALTLIERSVLFEGELFAGLPAPSTAGNPRQGALDPGRLSFAYFSLATQRKVGRLSGRNPDGLLLSRSHTKRRAYSSLSRREA
jgi:hypothetical protein